MSVTFMLVLAAVLAIICYRRIQSPSIPLDIDTGPPRYVAQTRIWARLESSVVLSGLEILRYDRAELDKSFDSTAILFRVT